MIYSQVISSSNCTVYPLDEAVIAKMPTILEIHDAIIVATGLVIQEALDDQVVLLTGDEAITDSEILETIW